MAKELVAMVNNPTDEDIKNISDALGELIEAEEEDNDGDSED